MGMKKFLLLAAAALLCVPAFADEGMWLLPLLGKMNKKDLAAAGCKLTPEEIYSVNNSSLKDAIVHFGGGCTGEIISDEGLIVTNHHCGYSHIQKLSTPEHNYLMDGFWALRRDMEIPCPGLSVTFLVEMKDITEVLEKAEKKGRREEKLKELTSAAGNANPDCEVITRSFYNDNVTYLIVSKVYDDVRFVGAPPASVGKFGGETDNWMWPRHTGDFSMFRVYMAPDGSPAGYSAGNVPLRAKNHLKISLEGVKEGDYAMIMGYPGTTRRFQTAAQLEDMIAKNRISIDARTVRQDLMWEQMCADPRVQLEYASKYASSANGWKKWQGMELAFKKLDIIGREKEKEERFMEWTAQKPGRTRLYGSALGDIAEAVEKSKQPMEAYTLLVEAPYRIELVGLVGTFFRGVSARQRASECTDEESFEAGIKAVRDAYRDYEVSLDRKEAAALLGFYRDRADKSFALDSLGKGFEDFETLDIERYADWLFEKSAFTSIERLSAEGSVEVLRSDPAAVLQKAVISKIAGLYPAIMESQVQLSKGSKAFTAGLLEWEKGKASYPDANSTMRLTYGHVLPYSPKDAVLYRHYTTLTGVMEKEDPTNPEFIVPEKLKQLYGSRDFGRYGEDGMVRTCFLTNNDITGGNSGSPVLNARGELIGLAFDGNWESMSSDVMFEPDLQRCICVDIRYVLFLVEKLGGAKNIIDELDFAN